jgi:hypothetical protein
MNLSTGYQTEFATLIGGGFATGMGGYINIYPFSTPPTTYVLDVALWRLNLNFEQTPLICGGSVGATDARQVGYSYLFDAVVIWDFTEVPETLLRGIRGVELQFFLGFLKSAELANNSDPSLRYYWTPCASIEGASPVLDANGKRMTRAIVRGRCRSHLFLIPDCGDPNVIGTTAGAYRSWFMKTHINI